MKLQQVVISLSRRKLEAVVLDPDGLLRKVDYGWKDREGKLPTSWYETVVGEIIQQMASRQAK